MHIDSVSGADNSEPADHSLWCRLIRDRQWSSAQKHQLIEHYGSPSSVFDASTEAIRSIISGRQRKSSSCSEEPQISEDLDWLSCENHHLIPFTDDNYPDLLRQLSDPPLALFAVGNINLLVEPKVAIVGSRRPTPVGDKVTRDISRELADIGIVVTSGMALGIDGAAHQAALSVGGGRSIAVLGNGLDTVYPSRHRGLYEQLCSEGLLISEYPLGVKPSRYTFPQRNRIVSGLAYGVVIVEAAKRSGTLITARLAMEQNREVMVVPGSALSEQYLGSHQLIQQGAALVSNSSEVVACLSEPLSWWLQSIDSDSVFEPKGALLPEQASDSLSKAQILLRFISTESTSIDHISISSQLTSAEVSSMLLELELIGAVAIANDGGYVNLS